MLVVSMSMPSSRRVSIHKSKTSYIFLLWVSDPTHPLLLRQHRKHLWVHICTRTHTRNCRCFDLTSKSRPWTAFLWSRQCFCSLTGLYQVKHLLDLDFIHQTRIRFDHKTRKELPGKSFVGLRPAPPSCYFWNDEVWI